MLARMIMSSVGGRVAHHGPAMLVGCLAIS